MEKCVFVCGGNREVSREKVVVGRPESGSSTGKN